MAGSRHEMPELGGARRPRPAAWTGAGAVLMGALWAAVQLATSSAQAKPPKQECQSDKDVADLRQEIRDLQTTLNKFNERLSHMEGRLEVKTSGIVR